MAAIKQGLEQKLQQKLSPLQIQTIKLIEMPVQALEQHVREVLNDNPVVDDTPQGGSDDEPRDVSISQVEAQEQSGGSLEENYGPQDDDIPSYNLHVNNWGKDERPEYNTFSVKQSFTQSLQEQLGYHRLPGRGRLSAKGHRIPGGRPCLPRRRRIIGRRSGADAKGHPGVRALRSGGKGPS